jgi:hypothetical protein
LAAFVLLVVPGIVYGTVLRHAAPGDHKPASPFQEASYATAAGLVLSTLSGAVLVLAARAWPDVAPPPDVSAWLANPAGPDSYLVASHAAVLRFAAVLVLLACILGVLAALAIGKIRRQLVRRYRYGVTGGELWDAVFAQQAPPGKVPYVSVTVAGGAQVAGYVRHWTRRSEPVGRLVLSGPHLRITQPGRAPFEAERWQSVVVFTDRANYLKISFLTAADRTRLQREPEATATAVPTDSTVTQPAHRTSAADTPGSG